MKLHVLGVAALLLLTGCSTVPSAAPTPASSPSASPTPVPSVSPTPEPATLSLAVTGDVLLHPTLLDEAEQGENQYDFGPLLAGLKPYIQDADVALCNLETPIGEPPYRGYPMFTVPPQIVSDLKDVGYDGCTTATNHTVDDGTAGVIRTIDTLDAAGMFFTGSYRTEEESQRPPILEVNGVKLAVITSTYSLNGLSADTDWRVNTDMSAESLIARAEAARDAGAQIVVAAVHNGAEYTTAPTTAQRKLGRDLADSQSFDFVYMHHTHSVQPIEKRRGTWIVYGLGNSVAKHATPNILNREGVSVKATFTEQADASWEVSELAWVPHFLTESPVRWCQVATESTCVDPESAAASLERSTQTIDAYDAIADGLLDWVPAARSQ